MRFPFVSRDRYEETKAVSEVRISDLSLQVKELTEERKRLADFIAVRSNNASLYGLIKPPEIEDDEPVAAAEEIEDLPPTRARQFAKRAEEKNVRTFRAEEDEVTRLLAEVTAAGRKAAESGQQAQA